MSDKFSNIILVSGSGRNIGKTTLICQIIEKFKNQQKIYAIKLSPHFHNNAIHITGEKVAVKCNEFTIYKETTGSVKDSGRYLNAGASEVFYIESQEQSAVKAFLSTISFIPANSLIVCESGSLFGKISPVFSIFVIGKYPKNKPDFMDRIENADLICDLSEDSTSIDISCINLIDNKWMIHDTPNTNNQMLKTTN